MCGFWLGHLNVYLSKFNRSLFAMNGHVFGLCRMRQHVSRLGFLNRFQTCRSYVTPLDEYEDQAARFLQMPGLNERQKKNRRSFFEAEKVWDAQIRWEALSQQDVDIVRAHKEAVVKGHFTYDAGQGRKVMTRLRHFLRGSCCGNAMWELIKPYYVFFFLPFLMILILFQFQCIYNHENIPESMRGAKEFNSAFWVDAKTSSSATVEDSEEPYR